MNYSDNYLNNIIENSINFVDNSLLKFNYNNDIKQLLYIIIPSFILKYGIENKNKIFHTFEEVPMIISNKEEQILQAFYTSIPIKKENNIITKKFILIHNYQNKKLIELIDNIIHEYNHAINSINNEIKEDDKYIYLRTGLTYAKYNKNNLLENEKDDSYILEEIINTKQTEDIINILNSFKTHNIINNKINILYNINIQNEYASEAYLFQSTICRELMNNKTFISVISSYRFIGNIEEIKNFFNEITGIDNSYQNLIYLLNKSVKIEEELPKIKFFKAKKIKKIYKEALEIINTFNNNYHYK